MERAAIFASDQAIRVEDLPQRVAQVAAITAPGGGRAIDVGMPVTLEPLEGEHIRLVLERSASREDAARMLGIDPGTLYRKRKHLSL
jgi:NtrC-family two-component system response regulator AlgB